MKTLLKEHATPGGLAASAAVGVFLGTLPLVLIHTIVIIYVTVRLNLNKVIAVSVQNLCVPPFIPVICIELGHYMRHGRLLTEASLETVLGQVRERLFEWFLGSLIVAPVAAVIVGTCVFFTARALRRKSAAYEEK